MTDADPADTPSRFRSLLQLVGVSGVVVAQPLLATFGDSPDYFVFRQATTTEIVVFASIIAFAPGVLAWALTLLAGPLHPRARGAVHRIAVAGFVVVGLLQITASWALSLWVGTPLALLGAVAVVAAAIRWPGGRTWMEWLAPAPLVFLALFLVVGPVSHLIDDGDVDPAELGAFASGEPPPVVVMVFDEWPLSSIVRTDGTIDAAVAPNVARLAERATWYRNTTTVSNLTNFAVPAILTGNLPEGGDRPDAAAQPENLFTLLGGTYELEVEESLTRLCPSSLCEGQSGGGSTTDGASRLRRWVGDAIEVLTDRLRPGPSDRLVTDGFVEPEAAVAAAEGDDGTFDLDGLLRPRPERLDQFLNGMARDEDPTVHYIHVIDPHTPYRHVPSGLRYPSDSSIRLISPPDGSADADLRADAAWPTRLDRQRLLLEVAHVDQLIGDVLDELETTGLYEDALVVLTSDHGIAFEPGEAARGLGEGPVTTDMEPDLLWVPLLVKAPGQRDGTITDLDARTIDIVPTVAGLLGIELPWEVDGQDLAEGTPTRGPKRFVRVAGTSFSILALDAPAEIRSTVEDVFERGTDALLAGGGPDRWWRVGPEPDLVGTQVANTTLRRTTSASHRLDDPTAYDDVDLSSGEAPLLVAGRITRGSDESEGTVAVLVGDVIVAVVPTYDDGRGPGRFAAMVDPEWFASGGGRVRVAELTRQGGRTVLSLVPEG